MNHITFYATAQIMNQELQKFAATLPEDSMIKVNLSSGLVEVGKLRTIHKVLDHDIRQRMKGLTLHGYSFHSSIRTVETEFVHWLNQQVSNV